MTNAWYELGVINLMEERQMTRGTILIKGIDKYIGNTLIYLNADAQPETLKMDGLLKDHLCYNHYPPVTSKMIEPCKKAIYAILGGDENEMISVGDFYLPANDIADDLNLEWFINNIN